MITKELLDYIKNEQSKGKNIDAIKVDLLKNGWSVTDVDEAERNINFTKGANTGPAISSISQSLPSHVLEQFQKPEEKEVKKPPSKAETRFFLILLIISIVTLGAGVTYAYFAGYFISLEQISSEAYASAQNAKSGHFDTTITVDLPKTDPVKENSFDLSMLGIIGQTISFTANGFFDINNPTETKFNTNLFLSLGTIEVGAEVIFEKDILYAMLTKVPNIPFAPTLTNYANKWVSFPVNEAEKSNYMDPMTSMVSFTGIDQSILTNLNSEQKDHIVNITKNTSFFKVLSRLPSESINDMPAYHFTFTLNKENLRNYLLEVETYLHTSGKNDSRLLAFDTKELRDEIEKQESFTGEAWVGKKDHKLYKMILDFNINNIEGTTQPIKIKVVSIFKDWDKPFDVLAPENVTTVESLINESMQDSQEKDADAAAKAALSNTKTLAEIFYSHNNSYKGFCSSKDLKRTVNNMPDSKKFFCKETQSAYAASAMLSDNTYWCVDSKGYSGTLKKKITTTLCK